MYMVILPLIFVAWVSFPATLSPNPANVTVTLETDSWPIITINTPTYNVTTYSGSTFIQDNVSLLTRKTKGAGDPDQSGAPWGSSFTPVGLQYPVKTYNFVGPDDTGGTLTAPIGSVGWIHQRSYSNVYSGEGYYWSSNTGGAWERHRLTKTWLSPDTRSFVY